MCKAKSFICVRGETEPRWSPLHDSHEKMVEELKLKDADLFNRGFVRVEYFPKNGDWFNPDDWEFCIDESRTIPPWFEDEKQLWKDRCWEIIGKKILPALACGKFLGDLQISRDIKAPDLTSVGGYLLVNSSVTLPKLTSVGGDLSVNSSVTLQAPKLTSVGGYLSVHSSVTLPKLTSVGGYLSVPSSVTLQAPKLTSVGGDLSVHSSAKFGAPKLKKVNGKPYKGGKS